MVPVIGLLQVGGQSMADRYTYIPLIGVFIMLSWGMGELVLRWDWPLIVPGLVAAALAAACLVLTWRQVGYWHDSVRLWQHALAVTEKNYIAHNNLGRALAANRDYLSAIPEYEKAILIQRGYAEAYCNLGTALRSSGNPTSAIAAFRAALRLHPGYAEAEHGLDLALRDIAGKKPKWEQAG
jgi:tetratricopeptide (TPR) repeat protein